MTDNLAPLPLSFHRGPRRGQTTGSGQFLDGSRFHVLIVRTSGGTYWASWAFDSGYRAVQCPTLPKAKRLLSTQFAAIAQLRAIV